MTDGSVRTVAQSLSRAVAVGRHIQSIKADWRLWRLSKAAWLAWTVEMGDFVRSPDATREHMQRFPTLRSEIETRAVLWVRHDQDRPGVWSGFGPHGDPIAYAELLASGITAEGASALAALRVGELRADEWWGRSAGLDPSDGEEALKPHLAELVELDKVLAGTMLATMLSWRNGKPVVEHAGLVVELAEHNVARIASEFAELAALKVREPAVAVAA